MANENTNDLAARVERHAEDIMRAAGSSLRHYEAYSRRRILSAMMDAYEEAYRAGADFAREADQIVRAQARSN